MNFFDFSNLWGLYMSDVYVELSYQVISHNSVTKCATILFTNKIFRKNKKATSLTDDPRNDVETWSAIGLTFPENWTNFRADSFETKLLTHFNSNSHSILFHFWQIQKLRFIQYFTGQFKFFELTVNSHFESLVGPHSNYSYHSFLRWPKTLKSWQIDTPTMCHNLWCTLSAVLARTFHSLVTESI